jgi:tRNA-specific 2-thiouridylase
MRGIWSRRIATGHYARTDETDGSHRLLRGKDQNKDQSYFLHTLGQDQLACTDFPVGELDKPAVRKIAAAAGLHVHAKKDSTGICFIGERNFREFLAEYVSGEPGEIRTPEGRVIGEHRGLMFHTLGQRQGLGIGGVRGHADAPWYVLHKDREDNVLYAGQDQVHPWLLSHRLSASQLNWVSGQPPGSGDRLQAQVRYRQQAQDCMVTDCANGCLELRFDQAQRAVTPASQSCCTVTKSAWAADHRHLDAPPGWPGKPFTKLQKAETA